MQRAETTSGGLLDKFCSFKIGPVPLPLYICFAIIIFAASYFGKLPTDMIGGFAVMLVLGILLGDMGLRIPVLKDIGGPAILSIFIPSVLVYYSLLDGPAKQAIIHFTAGKNGGANFLYFYIACLVTGSILGMLRQVLIQGFLRMFVPLILGTVASCLIGTAVGTLLGHGMFDTFFYIVVPIISGGVGEGILPLSAGYAEIQGTDPGSFIAMVAPAAMLGNVTAIICAGILKRYAIKNPHQTGNGKLVRVGDDNLNLTKEEEPIDVTILGMGLLTACCFYLFGLLVNLVIPIPAPIIMILSAAIARPRASCPRWRKKPRTSFTSLFPKTSPGRSLWAWASAIRRGRTLWRSYSRATSSPWSARFWPWWPQDFSAPSSLTCTPWKRLWLPHATAAWAARATWPFSPPPGVWNSCPLPRYPRALAAQPW